MTDILNIDDLAASDVKKLKIKGVEHFAAELTVQEYINRVRNSKAVPDDATMDVKIEETVKLLVGIFPTVGAEAFLAMPLVHLGKILEFALAPPSEIAATVEKEAAEGNAPKVSKKKQ